MWEKKQIKLLELFQQTMKMVFFSILVSFLFSFFNFNLVLAQESFSWVGEDISFNNKTFVKQSVQGDNQKTFYIAKDGNKAHVLVFDQQVQQATSANYVIYDLASDGRLTNPSSQGNVSRASSSQSASTTQTTPSSENSNSAKAIKPENGSSCVIDGVGWILCPIMNTISEGLDGVQSIVASFMDLKPITTDQNSVLIKSWRVVRNISNIVFIIIFLIIIASYITNYGVNNYDVKKTLPRLIIGVLMVNISFYLCAIAVDLSNIVGSSIVDLFKELESQTGGYQFTMSWAELTKAVLSGGALAVGGTQLAVLAYGGVMGIMLALSSALIGAIITLVVTVIILAGRQAMIIVLVIVSPLAFVATLMPNTSGYFTKWLDMMKKLLFLFPVFAVIYGSSQLAGWIIISSAQNIIAILLGMTIQVIPFLILPKLVKDSDSMLGKLSDGLNKTIFDNLRGKSKSFFDSGITEQKAKYLAKEANTIDLTRKLAQTFDKRKRAMEERTSAYNSKASSNYIRSKAEATSGSLMRTREAEITANALKTASEGQLAARNEEQLAEINRNLAKNFDKNIKELNNKNLSDALKGIKGMEREIAKNSLLAQISASELEMAKGVKAESYNKLLQNNIDLNNVLGKRYENKSLIKASTGIYNGEEGSEAAVLSKMISSTKKEYSEAVKNVKTTMDHYRIKSEDLEKMLTATKEEDRFVIGTDSSGNTYKFNGNDLAVWEAAATKFFPYRIDALTKVLKETHIVKDINDNVVESGVYSKYATILANIIREYGMGKSATYLGNVSPELIEQGKVGGKTLDAVILNQLVKGRFSSNDLINQDKDALEAVAEVIENFNASKLFANGGNGKFNDKNDVNAMAEIGFGIDNLTSAASIKGMKDYQQVIHKALDPAGETFRQLKEAQIKNLRRLDTALSKHTGIPTAK